MRLADLRIETVGRVVVARLEGEIDLSNATELGGVIADRVPNEALGLVIDLTKVDYVDSAGIHVLFDLRARLRNRGQEIALVVQPGAEIFEALRIAYLPGVVGVFDNLDSATQSIADKPPPGH
jgi:anti-sigma B factor antagonist